MYRIYILSIIVGNALLLEWLDFADLQPYCVIFRLCVVILPRADQFANINTTWLDRPKTPVCPNFIIFGKRRCCSALSCIVVTQKHGSEKIYCLK